MMIDYHCEACEECSVIPYRPHSRIGENFSVGNGRTLATFPTRCWTCDDWLLEEAKVLTILRDQCQFLGRNPSVLLGGITEYIVF